MGVNQAHFQSLTESPDPFLCPTCVYQSQQKTILDLQDNVRVLTAELLELKATVAALERSTPTAETNSAGGGQVRGGGQDKLPWNVVARGKKQGKGKGSTSTSKAYISQPPCDNGPAELWSQMVRKGRGKGPGKGKGKGMDKEPKSTSHAQPAQPSLSSQPSKRPSRPSKPVPNKRKIWGTPRVCTASSVKKAITQLAGVEGSKVEVKRKYKKDGEKLVKWWHVVRADEGILDKLEQEWSKVNVQTSWQLVPCLIFYDNAQVSNPSNQDTQAFVENKAPNTGGSNAVDNDVVENNTAAASSNNGVQLTVNQSHASPEVTCPPLHPEQISFSSSFLEQ